VTEILNEAEASLLKVLAEAAVAGEYEAIDRARLAAEGVRRAAVRVSDDRRSTLSPAPLGGRPSVVSRSRKSPKKQGYPMFSISDGALLKTGWSKKSKKEYAQRVPKESFDRVVDALKEAAQRSDGPVSSDLLFSILATAQPELPSYQAYSALGFLQARSVIRKVGRGEYALPQGVEAACLQAWEDAAEKEGGA
jgi:hypothetical protein